MNPYLDDEDVRKRLAAHNSRLIRHTTVEYFDGEPPEVGWVFHRTTEFSLLWAFLDQFTLADFRAAKVLFEDAAGAVYGSGPDDYLLRRLSGILRPRSDFNKAYGGNGQVYVALWNGTVGLSNCWKLYNPNEGELEHE